MECKYCSRLAKNVMSNIQHEMRCKLNPTAIIVKKQYSSSNGNFGKKGKNQYTKAKELGLAPPVLSEAVRKKRSDASKNQVWSPERRLKHSQRMKEVVEQNPDSYTSSNRGRTKQIEYNGIKFQGQWELDFYKWAEAEGYSLTRVVKGFKYNWNGVRTYFPDFYIESKDLYIEIKGYETERDRAKWEQFPCNLQVIKEDEIKQIRKGCFGGL